MRTLYIFLLALLSAPSFAQGLMVPEQKHNLTWYTNLEEANALSQKTKKPIFAFFTGSDWCGWCHKLEAAVFEKAQFQEWAKKNVILLDLDFPRKKTLPEAQQQQNNSLQQAFQVQGFPTIWIFTMNKDAATNKVNLTPYGQLGYPQSEPGKEVAAFLETANKILSNKPKS